MARPRTDAPPMRDSPLRAVQVEALAVMKIIKHSSQQHPTIATGALVGLDVNGVLQITNCFTFPTVNAPADGQQDSASSLATAAPRAKANTGYQNEMIRLFKEVNVDANNAGWYMSTTMGNFISQNTIENQFFYQKEINEKTVALVHDVGRSSQGALSLKAFRLSSTFMTAYREGKFTVESLQKSNLRYQDILVELPVTIHNSHLITSLLHQLPAPVPTEELSIPPTLDALQANAPAGPLAPNFAALDLSIDPFLEKTSDLLLESIETHHTELNNHQYYQRSLAREQSKITAWQAKRKAENAARVAAKQAPLPEDEWQRLFKLPVEPSRLEIMVNSRQIEQYARQVDGFAAGASAKMFAVRGNLIPEADNRD
ncbi:putative eukaryotic translation initiation factor 3 subunit EifCh [Eremomyces bilateralis CBS 781.70]|uniref:Eukaryotic translation initiation factor 3 subunit H n=1 Tax=Eremomyces bilateralis CBS 781.70 TaxID=1392243 RepID=A0A6G1GHC0_9PEZI|nr:putative eukaryotic translation initiation factor 3 subunit EifCh [Eremomyces bilateralis CBS 781.70]KAF1817497.1 putative eukaryotic translation initiation factor 3 subunit EifCh [Eremomyces bilateralis CBS 781.70]